MPKPRDVVLLLVDDAVVTAGAQFREVALGLLITQLNPAASSYAVYFLVGSIPGLVLARAYAWASTAFAPRWVMAGSYAVRFVLVLGLWRAQSFWAALLFVGGIAAGSGLYSASQAQYVASPGDYGATRRVVTRLRQAESLMRLVGPLAAGAALTAWGFRDGFLLSAAAYLLSGSSALLLSPQQPDPNNRLAAPDWRPNGPAMAILGLSFLTWQANSLALAYTFHVLHRHAFGYGLTLSVWGGSGLLASALLNRIQQRPLGWIGPLFLLMGATWVILAQGTSFPVFVVLGGLEGMASWLIGDLVLAHILTYAEPGRAGAAQARLRLFSEIGSIAGTAAILVMPQHWLIRPLYGFLGGTSLLAGGIWTALTRRKRNG